MKEKGGNMQIFVDADACPVVSIVEHIAEKYQVPVTLLCDTNHILHSDYSEVMVVGAESDAVDYKLISLCHKGDIVVSQDYGVAAMALGKRIALACLDEEGKADYGKKTVKKLSKDLKEKYGKGFDFSNLYKFVKFYRSFPNILDAL
jgi:uncharacterized protein YaiI (UPF0178 family)